jgi:hypothetical protein
MAFQYGTTLRNNQVAQIQATIGAAGLLKIFSGAEPANCGAADPAGLLATIALPAAFLTSSGGVTTIAGSWTTAASGTGIAASWRMYDGGGVCQAQGNMSDLVLNNNNIAAGQTVSVTQFTVTAGNA